MEVKRGIGIVTFNRSFVIGEVVEAVLQTMPADCRVVVADDGSTDDTIDILKEFKNITIIRGQNKGVAANKNRILCALQDSHYLAIIEDDLIATDKGWFTAYEEVCTTTGIHHFCRVQDEKTIEETVPEFTEWLGNHQYTPVYGEHVRGDFTFISAKVIRDVGAFNPQFIGAGYSHGHWSWRVDQAGLIPHINKWIDIKEGRDKFVQKGDTEGGRWLEDKRKIKQQLKDNHSLARRLRKEGNIYVPLCMP